MGSAPSFKREDMKTIVASCSTTACGPATMHLRTAAPPGVPDGHDICVAVDAVSVNPVDAKLLARLRPGDPERILGFDAAGTVLATGPLVVGLEAGDRVYYAGDITRPGSHAEQQLVDSRIVALAPATLEPAQAACLPLVSLTAWELLFCRMPFQLDCGRASGRTLLVIGGAGGVGSMAIQLARHAGFRVVATASRPQSQQWCRELGAHLVVDHSAALGPQLAAHGMEQVDVVLNLADTDAYWAQVGELIAPQGHVGLIVEPAGPLPLGDPYKAKSVSLHWEFMFTRSRYGTADLDHQHRILARVASLVDAGVLRCPHQATPGPISPDTLAQALDQLAGGHVIGKLALAGWD